MEGTFISKSIISTNPEGQVGARLVEAATKESKRKAALPTCNNTTLYGILPWAFLDVCNIAVYLCGQTNNTTWHLQYRHFSLPLCNNAGFLCGHITISPLISGRLGSFHFAVVVSRTTLHILNSFHPLSLPHFGRALYVNNAFRPATVSQRIANKTAKRRLP